MDWKLTDADMILCGVSVRDGVNDLQAAGRVAQAQARKLVKWLSERCEKEESGEHDFNANFHRIDCLTCWQELKRQVGL